MSRHKTAVLLLLLWIAFGVGIWRLFVLRYQKGDVYPTYSSFRADPLGSLALYEGLRSLPELRIRRQLTALTDLPDGQGKTLLYLGEQAEALDEMERRTVEEIESFVRTGGRLVLSFVPEAPGREEAEEPTQAEEEEEEEIQESEDAKPHKTSHPSGAYGTVSLCERWGLGYLNETRATGETVGLVADIALPAQLAWHCRLRFKDLDPAWLPVYSDSDSPVLIHRRLGSGTLIMVGDSYLFSNEAIRRDRASELLAWFVGPSTEVIFDETHLGILSHPGVAGLARKHHLEGVVLALVVLACLFLWMSAVPFIPRSEEVEAVVEPGRDSASGFTSLLRRNLGAKGILDVCFEEWKKSLPGGPPAWSERVADMEARLQAEKRRAQDRDPVRAYQEMSKTLTERKDRRGSEHRSVG